MLRDGGPGGVRVKAGRGVRGEATRRGGDAREAVRGFHAPRRRARRGRRRAQARAEQGRPARGRAGARRVDGNSHARVRRGEAARDVRVRVPRGERRRGAAGGGGRRHAEGGVRSRGGGGGDVREARGPARPHRGPRVRALGASDRRPKQDDGGSRNPRDDGSLPVRASVRARRLATVRRRLPRVVRGDVREDGPGGIGVSLEHIGRGRVRFRRAVLGVQPPDDADETRGAGVRDARPRAVLGPPRTRARVRAPAGPLDAAPDARAV